MSCILQEEHLQNLVSSFFVIYNLIIIYKIYNLINKDLAIAWQMDSVVYASIIFNAFSHLLLNIMPAWSEDLQNSELKEL